MKISHQIKVIKEFHIWTSEEKIKFCGYGEWVEEIDSLQFEYMGYKALIYRILKKEPFVQEDTYFGGHLCGYVIIPEYHPYFKQKEINIVCHGGITFNECHEKHIIGFDCSHSTDYIPTMEKLKNFNSELIKIREDSLFNPIYRNVNFCIEECKSIIEQLELVNSASN